MDSGHLKVNIQPRVRDYVVYLFSWISLKLLRTKHLQYDKWETHYIEITSV